MSFIRTIAIAGVFATATAFTASASVVINASIVPNPTAANVPFTMINLGSGFRSPPASPSGAVQTGGVAGRSTSVPGMTITYFGRSGIYVGDSAVSRSPFRDAAGVATARHYLSARPPAGDPPRRSDVTIVLDFPTTQFNLLWGSVDIGDADTWNNLTIGVLGETITGGEIVTAAGGVPPGGSVILGRSNIAVSLLADRPFTTLTFTATQNAFEFLPGVPVPEPATLGLLGAGLLGLGFALRRRRDA